MATDEMNALLRIPRLMPIYVGTAQESGCKSLSRTAVAAEKSSHVIPKPAVPLSPAVADEASHLVKPSRVPCLGDQLDAGQDRVRVDIPEDRRGFHGLACLVTRQDRGEVEAEAVHVHLFDPVAEAVEDHPPDY